MKEDLDENKKYLDDLYYNWHFNFEVIYEIYRRRIETDFE